QLRHDHQHAGLQCAGGEFQHVDAGGTGPRQCDSRAADAVWRSDNEYARCSPAAPLCAAASLMNLQIAAYQSNDLRGVLSVLAQAMPLDPISESRFVRQV